MAIALAKTSECRQRHGALIVGGGSVIAAATNKHRNHPKVFDEFDQLYGTSFHAEFSAIRRLNYVVPHRAVLYVARVNKKGFPLLSRPCNTCWRILREYQIKKVVYTVDPDFGGICTSDT